MHFFKHLLVQKVVVKKGLGAVFSQHSDHLEVFSDLIGELIASLLIQQAVLRVLLFKFLNLILTVFDCFKDLFFLFLNDFVNLRLFYRNSIIHRERGFQGLVYALSALFIQQLIFSY